MIYMFQYDSTHGTFNSTFNAGNRKFVINGRRDPANIEWGGAGAEYAVESTDICTTMEKAGVHFKCGAKRVISILSVHATMIVMGVNHEKYDNSLNIVRMLPVPATA